MKKLLLTIAIASMTLVSNANIQAGPNNGNSIKNVSSGNSVKHNVTKTLPIANAKLSPSKNVSYHLQNGTKFAQGYLYKGKNHCHWGLIRWDVRYGCNCYWDPCLLVWYYWCEPDQCFYPVSYCPYRRYTTEIVVLTPATQVIPMAASPGVTTILPSGVVSSSATTGVVDIPPIPEPVVPRS